MITFDQVSKIYGDTAVVKDLTLTIETGEIFVFIGPSGSGKTTSLKMINKLIENSKGDILIDGKPHSQYDLHELRWNIGYVLQQIALFPNMTVEENIALVPEMKEWDKESIDQRINELLIMVNLDPKSYRKRSVSDLSGGQQQRIGVLRALAANPDILLMDEPFSALDPLSRSKLQDELLAIQGQLHKTIVFVTHDIQEALKLGDRICIMKDGQVEQIGTPDQILNQPESDFVKNFVKTGLPTYPDQDHIDQVIAGGFYSKVSKNLEGSSSLQADQETHALLQALSQKDSVYVLHQGQSYLISQTDYLQYLSKKPGLGGRGKWIS